MSWKLNWNLAVFPPSYSSGCKNTCEEVGVCLVSEGEMLQEAWVLCPPFPQFPYLTNDLGRRLISERATLIMRMNETLLEVPVLDYL